MRAVPNVSSMNRVTTVHVHDTRNDSGVSSDHRRNLSAAREQSDLVALPSTSWRAR
jgi:hypothetical protein